MPGRSYHSCRTVTSDFTTSLHPGNDWEMGKQRRRSDFDVCMCDSKIEPVYRSGEQRTNQVLQYTSSNKCSPVKIYIYRQSLYILRIVCFIHQIDVATGTFNSISLLLWFQYLYPRWSIYEPILAYTVIHLLVKCTSFWSVMSRIRHVVP